MEQTIFIFSVDFRLIRTSTYAHTSEQIVTIFQRNNDRIGVKG